MDLLLIGSSVSKKDMDTQPLKSGTMADLDEEGEKNEDSQPAKTSDTQNSQVQ